MRINLNHCFALSMPKPGCLERACLEAFLISGVIVSMRLRHLMSKLRASSLLILLTGIFAANSPVIFILPGGNRPNDNTTNPLKVSPADTGLQLLSVHFSSKIVDPNVDCKICE